MTTPTFRAAFAAIHLFAVSAGAAVVDATFNSPTDVPVTAASYTAIGNTVNFTLNHTPTTGANLMVVKNTSLAFIQGTFGNLAQGQNVDLAYGGLTYNYVANYYGGTGNDLILQWADTSVMAWGRNDYGQLGNNSTNSSSVAITITPSGILSNKKVVSISAGYEHSIALCSDGTVAAWGSNLSGQLGNNSTANSLVPVSITSSGILFGKTVVAIAAGSSHNLALCSDGTVAAWGKNDTGQLGNGGGIDRNVPVAVKTNGILAGKKVVAIAAGGDHSLALCSDGTLAIWGYYVGYNVYGFISVPVSKSIIPGKSVVAIAAGYHHSLALCSDGTLATWGFNAYGQLGNNSVTNSSDPVVITSSGILAGKTVVAIAAGFVNSLVLCSDGTVATWGDNSCGQLGNNSVANSGVPVAITYSGILSGKNPVAISAGGFHNQILCSDGTAASWGLNTSGQLGNNSTTNSNVPVIVSATVLMADERFVTLGSGQESKHNLAIVATQPGPVVSTAAATSLLSTGTTLNGFVKANSNSYNTTVMFEYGLTTAYGTTLAGSPSPLTGSESTAVCANLSGLTSSTTYHYRVIAINALGTSTGADMTFITLSTNANLSGLVLETGTLSPVFNSATTEYTTNVSNDITSITIKSTLADTTASVKVNGILVSSGNFSGAISLAVGHNTINVVVTAQDGTTTKTYTVTVTRAPSAVSTLSGLALSSGTLSPTFASATTSYSASVTNATTSLTVTPTVTDTTGTLTVNGTTVASGNASGSITLAVGTNVITTVVTAQDGVTTKTYTVTVTRISNVSTLSGLVLSSGTLSPAFAPTTTTYSANVTNTTTSITVRPTVTDATATIQVNGTTVASGANSSLIPLSVGPNTISVVVTAQDGTTTNIYTVDVTRTLTLTIDTLSNGSITGVAIGGNYLAGTTATLTAVPAAGYVFTGWTGDASGTTNPLSVLMDADKTIGATFSLGVKVLADGQVPAGSEVVWRGPLTVTMQTAFANGAILYTLDGSAPSLGSMLYTGPLILGRSCTVRAVAYSSDFSSEMQSPPLAVVIVPTLTATTAGGGSFSVQPPDGAYSSGSMATLTATPATGWTFLQWLGDAAGTNPVTSVQMTRNKYVQAVFGTTVTTTTVGSGSIWQSPVAAFYPYGTRIRFSGLPASGNYLAFWSNAVSSTANPLDFLVTTPNPTLTAVFQPLGTGQFALALVADGGGKVVAAPAANRYSSGANVRLTVQPDLGQDFVGWSGNAAGSVNPLTVAMNQSKAITAAFTKRPGLRVGTPLEGLVEDGFRLTLTGEFGKQYEILGSADLVNWIQAGTLTNVYGTSQFTDGDATNQPRRFYRAALLNP